MHRQLCWIAGMMLMCVGCQTTGQLSGYDSSTTGSLMSYHKFVSLSTDVTLPVRMYQPEVVGKVPLIVYLHGMGQRGTDNEQQIAAEGVNLLVQYSVEKNSPAVILAPQCPTNSEWEADVATTVIEMIERFKKQDFIDEDRVIITGFSMGASGTFNIALMEPDIASVYAPVCAGPLVGKDVPDEPIPAQLDDKQFWVQCGYCDTTVVPDWSKQIVGELWSRGCIKSVQFTMHPSYGHDTKPYRDLCFLYWLFNSSNTISN